MKNKALPVQVRLWAPLLLAIVANMVAIAEFVQAHHALDTANHFRDIALQYEQSNQKQRSSFVISLNQMQASLEACWNRNRAK